MSGAEDEARDRANREGWTRVLAAHQMEYPDENVVRFLGRWPAGVSEGRTPRALDVGCGSGRHARALAAFGYEVLAVDYAPEVIARAVEAHAAHDVSIRFACLDLCEVAQSGERFDRIVAWGVLFLRPLERMREDLRDLAACLRPGGLLLANFHTPDSWLCGLGDPVGSSPESFHLDERAGPYAGMVYTFLRAEQVRELLEDAGLEVEREERVEYWKAMKQRMTWSVFYARVRT
jgi:SAM-dependent methyltransferase